MYNNTNCTPLSLLPVNDKITASCHTNMSPKHYFRRYLFRICFVIYTFSNVFRDNFCVSLKLVAVPINFVTQLRLKKYKVTLLHLWYNAACLWLACPLLHILLHFSSTFSLPLQAGLKSVEKFLLKVPCRTVLKKQLKQSCLSLDGEDGEE